MLKISTSSFILLFSLCVGAINFYAQEKKESYTIYLIRHSEKKISHNNQYDPPLSKCGIERSNYLNSFFKDISLENIYSTDYLRTKNTAMPIAFSKQLKIEYYDENQLRSFSDVLIESEQNSLVIGHSDTTGVLAGLLVEQSIGAFDTDIYDQIYKIIIEKNKRELFLLKSVFNCKK